MAPQEPPSEVTVRVKVPPGHIPGCNEDEFTLGSLSTSHPISTLRQRIQTLIPSNPPPATQRILYGGRALIDEAQTLADALITRRDPTQTEYVVHLLIRPGNGGARVETTGLPGLPTGAHARVERGTQPGLIAQPVQPGIQTTTNTIPHVAQIPHVQYDPRHHAPVMPPQRPVSSSGFHIRGTGPDGHPFTFHQHVVTNMPVQPGVPTAGVPPQMQFPGLPAGIPQMAVPGLPAGIPQMALPGLPAGIPQIAFPGLPGGLQNFGMPAPMPAPNMLQNAQPGQPPAVSALERARENITEMRRMLEQLRNENAPSDAARAQVTEIEQRLAAVNDYIEPFHVGPRASSRSASPARAAVPQQPQIPMGLMPMRMPIPGLPPRFDMPMALHPVQVSQVPPQHLSMQPASNDRTSVYLLSSPQGPHALVFSPQYGTYIGMGVQQTTPATIPPPSAAPSAAFPQPTPTQPEQAPQAANAVQVAPADQAAIAQLQAQADPLAFFQPVLGHLWLLLRIMIFAYIVMGSNMGWRRPIALALIGLGFWLIRLGLFGNGGLVRRWWDGVIRIENPAQAQVVNDPAQQAQNPDAQVRVEGQPGNAGRLPTPAEYAQRLIRERQERSPLHRLREQIRPAERALALFIASLWPGVGERYVQALDRAREEEEAAKRAIEAQREEAARVAREASEQAEKKNDDNVAVAESSAQGEKKDDDNVLVAKSSAQGEKQSPGESSVSDA